MPRKEWKELKKKQAKGFHTSAACFTALQPSYVGDCDGNSSSSAGGAVNAVWQAVFGASRDGEAGQITTQPQHLNTDSRLLLDTGRLSFGWGTGHATAHTGGSNMDKDSPAEQGSGDLAALFSHMLLDGPRAVEQQTQCTQTAGFSPLRAALASHLRLLGPSACSVIGLQDGAERPRDTR